MRLKEVLVRLFKKKPKASSLSQSIAAVKKTRDDIRAACERRKVVVTNRS